MPRLSRWFIRMALIYLALGSTFGALILFNKRLPFCPLVWRLLPLHIEYLFFGWTVQLILGVTFWIFPRFWRSHGDPRPVWLAFILLNGGIGLITLQTLWPISGWLMVGGRLAEIMGLVAYLPNIWQRVKRPGATRPSHNT